MQPSKLASALTSLFFLWGILFGLLSLIQFMDAASMSNLGVGTSSAVNMTILFWIGGCVFFGLASLICRIPNGQVAQSSAELHSPVVQEHRMATVEQPLPGDRSKEPAREKKSYMGCNYNLHADGTVVAGIDGNPMTWRDEAAFTAWIDRHPIYQWA